jgi:hypothetical protein
MFYPGWHTLLHARERDRAELRTPASDPTSTATSSWSPAATRKGPDPVFGGHDIGVATRAADLYDEGIAPLLPRVIHHLDA